MTLEMEHQNYRNHAQIVTLYHRILMLLLLAVLIGAVVNVFGSVGTDSFYSATLILALTIVICIVTYYVRAFPLKAQDRIIRLEEDVRHYRMTGEPLNEALTIRQIIGARFASDEEFLELLARAVNEDLSEKQIKQAIKSWRADHLRM